MDWSQPCSLWGLGTKYPDHFVQSYSAEEEVRKPNRSELCAHKEMVGPEHALSTSEYPPPQPSALLVLCTASWPGHVHPGFLEFTPDAGRWHRLLSHHAGVFLSKPLSRFSFARGQSNSGTSYPYLVCRFISSLNHCMLA